MCNPRIRKALKPGLNTIVPQGKMKYLSLDMLCLEKGGRHSGQSGKSELGLVVISGKCSIIAGDKLFSHVGARSNVFSGRASAVYVPPMTDYEIKAESYLEIALCRSKARKDGKPCLVKPEEVKVKRVGRGNWSRKVHDVIYDNVPAEHLVLGETFNPPGNWSSSPPHKHDVHNPPREAQMEEIYFFKIHPPQGFGIQRLYDGNGHDRAYTVKNGDAIIISDGYHPVAAAPGYKLYYLWLLAGKGRRLMPKDDPDHAWLKSSRFKTAKNGQFKQVP